MAAPARYRRHVLRSVAPLSGRSATLDTVQRLIRAPQLDQQMVRGLTDPGDHNLVDISTEHVGALAGWNTQLLQHGVPLTGIGNQHRPAAELASPDQLDS